MMSNEIYKLHGYIEYVSSPVGFVTPVFSSESGEYFVQVSTTRKRKIEWERIPDEYQPLVIRAKIRAQKDLTSFVYGFKWDDILFFGVGKDMAEYLSNSFLHQTTLGKQLAVGFINDWEAMEPVPESYSKEAIWKRCLDFVANESKTMPGIFLENFELIEYHSGLLIIKSKNKNIKGVFEIQFKDEIVSYIKKEIDDFRIEVLDSTSDILPVLPFFYFGGGEAIHKQASFIMQTRINPYKGFDNFIVCEFNVGAYESALNYIQKDVPTLLMIRGNAGMGKSHLLHSIAKQISSSKDEKKVGVYTVFPNIDNFINEHEIQQFEAKASGNDVIIIDDAHNLKTENGSFQHFVKLLRKWRESQKAVVLTYRDSYEIDMIPEIVEHYEQVVITQPDDIDKLKVIDAKMNDYNIHLTGSDILSLSRSNDFRSISDIQRYLTKLYLTENIKNRTRQIFLEYNRQDIYSLKWIESCVFDYFNLNADNKVSFAGKTDGARLNAKIISHFIQEILWVPHHRMNVSSEIANVDGYFYSIDSLQYYLFESKEFKEVILDIISDLIMRKYY